VRAVLVRVRSAPVGPAGADAVRPASGEGKVGPSSRTPTWRPHRGGADPNPAPDTGRLVTARYASYSTPSLRERTGGRTNEVVIRPENDPGERGSGGSTRIEPPRAGSQRRPPDAYPRSMQPGLGGLRVPHLECPSCGADRSGGRGGDASRASPAERRGRREDQSEARPGRRGVPPPDA